MSDNKRIKLDENNKLIVENATVTISPEGSNIDISGIYEVSGDDVKKLLSIINDNSVALSSNIELISDSAYVEVLTSNEEMYKILIKCYNECRDVNNKYVDLFVEHNKLCDKHNKLRDKYDKLVEKYNKYRLFNKIEIEGGEQ